MRGDSYCLPSLNGKACLLICLTLAGRGYFYVQNSQVTLLTTASFMRTQWQTFSVLKTKSAIFLWTSWQVFAWDWSGYLKREGTLSHLSRLLIVTYSMSLWDHQFELDGAPGWVDFHPGIFYNGDQHTWSFLIL